MIDHCGPRGAAIPEPTKCNDLTGMPESVAPWPRSPCWASSQIAKPKSDTLRRLQRCRPCRAGRRLSRKGGQQTAPASGTSGLRATSPISQALTKCRLGAGMHTHPCRRLVCASQDLSGIRPLDGMDWTPPMTSIERGKVKLSSGKLKRVARGDYHVSVAAFGPERTRSEASFCRSADRAHRTVGSRGGASPKAFGNDYLAAIGSLPVVPRGSPR